jgi:hypothetical protein
MMIFKLPSAKINIIARNKPRILTPWVAEFNQFLPLLKILPKKIIRDNCMKSLQ